MAYVKKYKNEFKTGDWVITKRVIDSCEGYFEKGTKVKIVDITTKGYDLMDEYGNRIVETGFDSVCEDVSLSYSTNDKIYIFVITFNFCGEYYAKKYDNIEDAKKALKDSVDEEFNYVKGESEYSPSILEWSDEDVVLVYAEGYDTSTKSNYEENDCAYYRIFEVEL